MLTECFNMVMKARSVELDLTDNLTAGLWITASKAKARSKKWKNTPAMKAVDSREGTEASIKLQIILLQPVVRGCPSYWPALYLLIRLMKCHLLECFLSLRSN